MQEYASPTVVDFAPDFNLTDTLFDRAENEPEHQQFSRRVDGQWQPVSAKEFAGEVAALAAGLVAAGIGVGDRVGLMSRTRYEWTLCDYAIWTAGGVSVPIYETSSPEQVQWNLSDSGATAVFVESEAHRQAFESVRGDLPGVRHVWQIDGGGLDELVASGREVPESAVDERRRAAGSDTLATIIYTSGTTGRPKGCELTHGNLVSCGRSSTIVLPELFRAGGSTLLFLPLAHVFARLIQVACVESGARMGHTADIKNLLADLGGFAPTFVLSVPRVFEKVYNTAKQRAHADGKGAVFDRAEQVAVAWSMARDGGRGPGLALRLQHGLFDRLVYGRLRAALGGRVEWAVSGGAPLGERLGHFFRGVGINILEGYGLTETTAAGTVNTPARQKIGTVGRPSPGVTVRIADDGEILMQGHLLYQGYWNRPDASAESLAAGWFHTGDIGELDAEGFLRITGRKKELIVTAGGKNVAPAVLEDRLRAHPLVSQCMVVGDRQPFIACLVTLDAEAVAGWLSHRGREQVPVAELTEDPALLAEIQRGVDEANRAVSKAEAIRRFAVLPVDWTEEGGQLTPSMKLKRDVVMREFADNVAALYAKPAS